MSFIKNFKEGKINFWLWIIILIVVIYSFSFVRFDINATIKIKYDTPSFFNIMKFDE